MASNSTPSSSLSSPSSLEPPTTSSPPFAAAHASLQVLLGEAALLPTRVQGVRQLLQAVAVLQGEDKAANVMHSLRTLRAALDDVLGDGASRDSAKRKRADPDQDDKITENQDTDAPTPAASTISTEHSTACARVLQTTPLLSTIVGWLFHERPTLASRVALGQTALVSKEWLHISRQACFWRPLARELMLAALREGRDQEGYFDCLASYGKCLVERQVLTGDSALFDGLELHIKIWNAAVLSGGRIYSAVGPIRAEAVDSAVTRLIVTGPQRKEVAGPAFFAVILDPVEREYSTIVDYIDNAHELNNPLHLCVRVRVMDSGTGKMALVSESGKLTRYFASDRNALLLQNLLPGAAYTVCSAGWTRLHFRGQKKASSSYHHVEGLEEMSAYNEFPLQLLPGQGHVNETE